MYPKRRGRREQEGEPRTLHAAVSLTLFRNTPQLVYTLPGESLNKLLASFRTREISTPRIAATIDFKRLLRATRHSRDWMTLRMASGKPHMLRANGTRRSLPIVWREGTVKPGRLIYVPANNAIEFVDAERVASRSIRTQKHSNLRCERPLDIT